jgi:antitoxin HigA-1
MVKQYKEGDELPLITPGDLLFHEYMEPCGLSMNTLARTLHVSPTAVSEIVRGQRAISTVMAKRLSLFFGNSIQMWLNMQQHYEIKLIERQVGKALENTITPFDYSTLVKDSSAMVCESDTKGSATKKKR